MTINLRAGAGAISYVAGVLFTHAPVSSGLLLIQAVVFGLAMPFEVWAINGLVDAVVAEVGATSEPRAAVLPWFGLLAVAFTMRSLKGAAGRYVAVVVQEQVEPAINRQLFEKAISVPLETFESPEYYQKLETGRLAVGGRVARNLQSAMSFMGAIVGAVGLLILYVAAHWLLAAFLVAVTVVVSIVQAWAAANFTQVNYRSSPLRREAGYWSDLLSGREAAPELRLFGLADHLIGLWSRVFGRHVAEMDRGRRRVTIGSMIEISVVQIAIMISGIALVVLASTGQISIGQLVALLYGLSRFQDATNTVGWSSAGLIEDWTRIAHLRDFLALDSERRSPSRGAKRSPSPFRQAIQFDGLGFTYPGSQRPALSGVNLTIRPNEHLALVGENGAGKTTLVRLLLGLYRPTEGRITVDGVDVADLDPNEWRQRATAIFQDFVRYPTTPFENIAFADPSLLAEEQSSHVAVHPRVVSAAAQAGADGFIGVLPFKYATPLGKEWEGGAELSIGQWQRLAIARAYLRDAQIIALDEPTAALDPRAEAEVYNHFNRASAGRTAILVSHRLGSARMADRIIVLREGLIVEEGDHDSLLREDGEYARMFRLQASWYEDSGES